MLMQLDAEPDCLNHCMQTTVSPYREDICMNRCHMPTEVMQLNFITDYINKPRISPEKNQCIQTCQKHAIEDTNWASGLIAAMSPTTFTKCQKQCDNVELLNLMPA